MSSSIPSDEKDFVLQDYYQPRWRLNHDTDSSLSGNTPLLITWSRVKPFTWIKNTLHRRRRSLTVTSHALSHTVQRKSITRRIITRLVVLMVLLFLFSSTWKSVFNPSYATLPQRYLDLEQQVSVSTTSGRGNVNNEKVFIAANILDEKLIRGVWGDNLVSLVDLLGEDNVFVSIYENDSGNGTSDALRQLQRRLKCESSIVTGDHLSLADVPTIRSPNGEERVARLAYLAEVRNRLLRPLDPSYHGPSLNGFQKAAHVKFDKILFLNDVYYSPMEAVHLLFSTNAASGRAQYRAACAIDFVQLFKMYDTFVVRDLDGYMVPLQFFPWFTSRGTGTSHKDVLSMTDAVRVRSCWGGMAAFDANVFQPQEVDHSSKEQQNNSQLALKFRANGEPFWEAAECCLIFADMEQQFGRTSESGHDGVFINPHIRTAYSQLTWSWLPFFKRYERFFEHYHNFVDFIKPPEWNPRRTHEPGQMVDELVWVNGNKTVLRTNPHYRDTAHTCSRGHFEVQHRPAAPGGFCGQRRMFVMKKDVEAANKAQHGKNWEKIRVPPTH